MPEVSRILTDVRFWSQVIRDQERTWICVPELEQQLRDLVEAHGLSHIITVMSSPGCPPNQVLIIDQQAQQAALNEWTSRLILFPRRAGKSTMLAEFDEFMNKPCLYSSTNKTCQQVMDQGSGHCCMEYRTKGERPDLGEPFS